MTKEHILVVEDEEDIRELVRYNLQKEGFSVTDVGSGEEALKVIYSTPPTLIVLDLMLPGVDGLEICRRLKKNTDTKDIFIIMLTAKSEEADVVVGLELGADDYITKPFSPRVLLARVGAVLRRSSKTEETKKILDLGDIVIHPGKHEVIVHDKKIDLTLTEFKILYYLASHSGWVFTRNQILDAVGGEGYIVTDRSVDVQIVSLRKKLGQIGKYIETVRGIGYKFREME